MKTSRSFEVQTLLRPHLRSLKPYSSARDEYSGKVGVFLDANENALGSTGGGKYHRYPDPRAGAVKAKLGQMLGLATDQIFLGNGSDEPIDLLIRAFCEPREEEILIVPPTYGMYQVSADINRVGVREVPLTADFQLNVAAMQAAWTARTKVVFLCSPNNPTGNSLLKTDVEQILQSAPGLVVLDEAYVDFAAEQQWLDLLNHYPNLLILRTFSKAWGLAGLRVGMALGTPALIAILNQIKPPYNLNQLSQEAVLEALDHEAEKDQKVKLILSEREQLVNQLRQFPLVQHIFPSDANFLLVKVDDPLKRYQQLIAEQIIVRDRSRVLLCEGCLRITVGTTEENAQLIQVLEAVGSEK